ncbi:hypothetical protein EU534_00460 [Candidatus Heimdallarchaeota archaeon]|nr:MAG: hypothetical protein EU534_00460 [Candidatus Heimdallarchaeota archaeon]
MPKISHSEQQFIRSLAKKYALKLTVSPFNEGLLIYSNTYDALYIRSARWKYCLKCGEIETTEEMLDEQELQRMAKSDQNKAKERVHKCTVGVQHFPVLITTSWYKLKEFFMSDKYIQALERAGVIEIPVQKPITEVTKTKVKEEPIVKTARQESSN